MISNTSGIRDLPRGSPRAVVVVKILSYLKTELVYNLIVSHKHKDYYRLEHLTGFN